MGTGQLLAIRRFSLGRGITADLSLEDRPLLTCDRFSSPCYVRRRSGRVIVQMLFEPGQRWPWISC